ncbi:TIR domain-containing protein [Ignavibacterium sp.]|uniref:TIR domain-containing protein n=1 Tax=Ignavibacterium sp. TaxID=2651167 RepID=UPI00220DB56C|nr:TIR domain-containing protein [Ignavibacterium sp.]BDQ03429.1 MAG: hypothetical protein KatS3mg037_2004 [Ignavibacterium sp.]
MKKKKTKYIDKLPKEIKDWLDEENRHYLSYNKFLRSLFKLPVEKRTTAWLEYVADDLSNYGDVESLIFLVSRGFNCDEKIEKLITIWKDAERKSIEECAAGASLIDNNTGKSTSVGRMSIQEASQIKNLSVWQLRNFWGYNDHQELSIDSTILRAVEWCKIRGFNDWWERLAKTTNENVIQYGIFPIPSSFWLFYHCRSDYSIKIMRKALERTLEALYIPEFDSEFPWLIHNDIIIDDKRKLNKMNHIPLACSIVFANYKLFNFCSGDKTIINRALEMILDHQNSDGSWNCWELDKLPDIETTAMAIHALAVAKPRGWKRSVKLAKNWLINKRNDYGYWTSASSPDAVFLTVLVLDAINLADNKSELTFSIVNECEKKAFTTDKRFTVALSFPGEKRSLVQMVSKKLIDKLGKDKVFYDKNFEAELARPNLDVYLQDIYHDQSELIVIFLCEDYNTKEWCGLEWRAIRDLIKKRKDEDILLLKLENVDIPGIYSIDGYVDISNKNPTQIAQLILDRLKPKKNK